MKGIYIRFFLLGFLICFGSCKQNDQSTKKDAVQEPQKVKSYELIHKLRMPSQASNGQLPLLILMHGLGSNEEDMFSLAQHLDKRFLVIAVRAPYEIGLSKYSWYDFNLNGGDFIYSYDQLKTSRTKLMKFIGQIQEDHNIDEEMIYLGGFSQGAIMSLATALTHSNLIDGAMVLSGDLLDELEEELKTKKIDKALNVYMSHGRLDPVLPFAEAEKDASYIDKLDLNFEHHWYDSKHSISQENYMSMNKWLLAQGSGKK